MVRSVVVRDRKLGSARRAVLALADEPQRPGIKVKLYALVGFAQDNSTLAHSRQERSCVKLGAALGRLEKDRLVVRKATFKQPAVNSNDAVGVDEETVLIQPDAHQAVIVGEVVVN